jgi:ABC-2 type transport system permease protein
MSRLLSLPLLRRTWRAQRGRLALVGLAVLIWSLLLPVVYATFGRQMAALLDTDIVPKSVLRLLGSDPFSLDGAVALGWIHPIGIGLQLLLPLGLGVIAIAGERQRGTLEVLLSRPVSRRAYYLTALVAVLGCAVATTLAALVGTIAGAALYDVTGDLDAGQLPLLALNTVLLLAALGGIALAASASFDRVGPPLGITLAVLLLGYTLEILGTLWPDAALLQPWSPFHYLQPLEILAGRGDGRDLLVLAAVFLAATAYGLWRFPRRDLAAPS